MLLYISLVLLLMYYSDLYTYNLSSSDLVPFTSLSLLFLCRPYNTSSPCLLLLRFIFLPLVYFPVCFHSIPTKVFTCHRIYSPLVLFTI